MLMTVNALKNKRKKKTKTKKKPRLTPAHTFPWL